MHRLTGCRALFARFLLLLIRVDIRGRFAWRVRQRRGRALNKELTLSQQFRIHSRLLFEEVLHGNERRDRIKKQMNLGDPMIEQEDGRDRGFFP